MSFLSGFIAIMGPPNVGKSTLLNQILGRKLAIVSAKPQTTRNRILGILHGEGFQMVFMDTPGIHGTSTALHRSMVESALSATQEVDMVVLMTEATGPNDRELSSVLSRLKSMEIPCILVINKIDLGSREQLLPVIDRYRKLYPFDEIVPVSALKRDGIDRLLDELRGRLTPGPPFFPEDMNTDQSEGFLAAEIIREKIFTHTSRELPYSCAVTVDSLKEVPGKDLLSIAARIHVERSSQKGIIIGEGGRMIKALGRSARLELEDVFGVQVHLDVKVRVEKNWTRDTRALRRLGY